MINYFHSQSRRHHSYTIAIQIITSSHQLSLPSAFSSTFPMFVIILVICFFIFLLFLFVSTNQFIFVIILVNCVYSVKGGRSANSDEGLWSSSSWKQPRHNQHPCFLVREATQKNWANICQRLFQHFHPAKIRRAARKYESCRCSAVRLKRA